MRVGLLEKVGVLTPRHAFEEEEESVVFTQVACLELHRAQCFRFSYCEAQLLPNRWVQSEVQQLELKQVRVIPNLVSKTLADRMVDFWVPGENLVNSLLIIFLRFLRLFTALLFAILLRAIGTRRHLLICTFKVLAKHNFGLLARSLLQLFGKIELHLFDFPRPTLIRENGDLLD